MKSKRQFKRMASMIGIVLLIFSMVGCKKTGANSNLVRVAYFPNITHTQALVMKNQGLLEKKLGEDYKVEWTQFNAGPAEVEALFAGEIDLGYIGPVPAVNAYVKSKGDVKIIAGATNGGAVLVCRKDVTMDGVTDLSGKKVAIPQLGNTQHLVLLHLLSESGMKTTTNGGDVEIVAAANADIKSLMEAGEVDAALVPEPWGSILINDVGAQIVLDYNEMGNDGNDSTAVVVVRQEFMDKNPDIVKAFLEVHKEATLYINESKEEAKNVVNNEIESLTSNAIAPEILNTAFNRLVVSWEVPSASIFQFAELNVQEGFADEVPDDKVIDTSVIDGLK